ncbi:nucleotidyl transferase AbiEii/AbiGii toxin family protein [Streptomyces sp. NBC_01264]|uniref:nucleotidyl transferase AbiEii/AbiGii toxin family protein n=1 Tax=Streptomyces sp. NBC_01264 TaxID=2903804 RepID=UPI002251A2C4|nr:nucleotidyl transferase AbiEii/AbiGii toxin family protein [Streptomyces sp. NBC_01264]MCX4783462.1 nucleotidyl transferase AbiEii/AbiGii toxin family protein [Streptomyces sp. NBC_01264]
MEDLHHRLIRIGLDALAEDFGYRLAGGYAVQAHRLVSRVSDDVDLFTPIGRAEGELPQAIARLVEAYQAAGYVVQVTQQAQVYARLHVTDPASGAQSKVELVGDLLHHPPVESDLGPVLHLDDLAAAKTGALFGRAEVRDAIDVKALLDAGYTRARLLDLAAQNEAEPNLDEYVSALARVGNHTDRQFAAYGLDSKAAHAIREEFTDWHRELIRLMHAEASSTNPAQAESPVEQPGKSISGPLPPSPPPPGPGSGRLR